MLCPNYIMPAIFPQGQGQRPEKPPPACPQKARQCGLARGALLDIFRRSVVK